MMAHIVYSIYYIPYTANICAIMHAVPSLLDPRPSTLTHAAQVLQNVSIKLTNGMSQAILKEQALYKALQLELLFISSINNSFIYIILLLYYIQKVLRNI